METLALASNASFYLQNDAQVLSDDNADVEILGLIEEAMQEGSKALNNVHDAILKMTFVSAYAAGTLKNEAAIVNSSPEREVNISSSEIESNKTGLGLGLGLSFGFVGIFGAAWLISKTSKPSNSQEGEDESYQEYDMRNVNDSKALSEFFVQGEQDFHQVETRSTIKAATDGKGNIENFLINKSEM